MGPGPSRGRHDTQHETQRVQYRMHFFELVN